MPDNDLPECPECERLSAVSEKSQLCGEFLGWLQNEKGYVLGTYHEHGDDCDDEDGNHVCGLRRDELVAVNNQVQNLLADFFKIDLNKVENERRALLEALRKRNDAEN